MRKELGIHLAEEELEAKGEFDTYSNHRARILGSKSCVFFHHSSAAHLFGIWGRVRNFSSSSLFSLIFIKYLLLISYQ